METKRLLSWLVLSTLIFVTVLYLRARLFPPAAKNAAPVAGGQEAPPPPLSPEDRAKVLAASQLLTTPFQWQTLAPFPGTLLTDADLPPFLVANLSAILAFNEKQAVAAGPDEDLVLEPPGAQIRVVLSKRGAAVRSITLLKFEMGDRETARPTGKPLVLVSDDNDA